MSKQSNRARELRQTQTRPEALVWKHLRARQICGLKFRRQHPIGPYVADFACCEKRLVVEIDGESHNSTADQDQTRTAFMKQQGWNVLRFNNEDVLEDPESVVRGVVQSLSLELDFIGRKKSGSGMFAEPGGDGAD